MSYLVRARKGAAAHDRVQIKIEATATGIKDPAGLMISLAVDAARESSAEEQRGLALELEEIARGRAHQQKPLCPLGSVAKEKNQAHPGKTVGGLWVAHQFARTSFATGRYRTRAGLPAVSLCAST